METDLFDKIYRAIVNGSITIAAPKIIDSVAYFLAGAPVQ